MRHRPAVGQSIGRENRGTDDRDITRNRTKRSARFVSGLLVLVGICSSVYVDTLEANKFRLRTLLESLSKLVISFVAVSVLRVVLSEWPSLSVSIWGVYL